MSAEEEKDKTARPAGDPAEPGEPPAVEADDAAAAPATAPAELKTPRVRISDELQKALEEAEASVNQKRPAPPPGAAGPEIEVEVGTEEEFDINKVDAFEPKAAPPPPSPAEMELKMQVLDLRQKVREAEAEVQVKIKELKQNAEQARMIKQQLDAQKAKAQREKSDWFNYGHEPLLKELLLVLDNLDRVLGHAGAETDVKGLREGVDLIVRQLMGTLKKFGVEPIQALGGPFNPEFHQAMMQKEDAEAAPGTVVEEHQKGYMLKDRLLRPAMVTVSKRPAAAGPEKGPDED